MHQQMENKVHTSAARFSDKTGRGLFSSGSSDSWPDLSSSSPAWDSSSEFSEWFRELSPSQPSESVSMGESCVMRHFLPTIPSVSTKFFTRNEDGLPLSVFVTIAESDW